jgi:hypothetical protein
VEAADDHGSFISELAQCPREVCCFGLVFQPWIIEQIADGGGQIRLHSPHQVRQITIGCAPRLQSGECVSHAGEGRIGFVGRGCDLGGDPGRVILGDHLLPSPPKEEKRNRASWGIPSATCDLAQLSGSEAPRAAKRRVSESMSRLLAMGECAGGRWMPSA